MNELGTKVSRVRHRYGQLLLLVLPLAATAIVFQALPRVFFGVDDIRHLVFISNRGALYFILEPFGGHMLFVRNAVFVLVHAVFGFHPAGYGWLSLVTHLLNVALLFRLVCSLTKNPVLAAFGATLWGVCVLHTGTLETHSVYGHALVGTVLLLVLDGLARAGDSGTVVPARRAIWWAVLLLLGSTCFGVGIGVAVLFPAVVAVVVAQPWRQRWLLGAFLPLPFVVYACYVANRWLFAFFERPPAFYPGLFYSRPDRIVATFGHLCVVGLTGLFGIFPLQTSEYPTPSSNEIVVGCVVALIVTLLFGSAKTRRWLVALLIVLIGAYGIIAVGRTNILASWKFAAEDTAKTFRYHYVGTLPLALMITLVVGELARLTRLTVLPAVVLVGLVLGTVFLHANTDWAINERTVARADAASVLRDIDERIDAEPAGADVYIPWKPLPPSMVVWNLYPQVPGNAGLFVAAYPQNDVLGRRVHFIEPDDQQGIFRDPKHRRFSTLMVTSDVARAALTRVPVQIP